MGFKWGKFTGPGEMEEERIQWMGKFNGLMDLFFNGWERLMRVERLKDVGFKWGRVNGPREMQGERV